MKRLIAAFLLLTSTASAIPLSTPDLQALPSTTTNGTAPTLSTCGTTPSIVGNDVAGTVTMGTAGPTACTLTFANAFTNAPHCVVVARDALILAHVTASSTTAVTFTATAACTSCVLDYICLGHK